MILGFTVCKVLCPSKQMGHDRLASSYKRKMGFLQSSGVVTLLDGVYTPLVPLCSSPSSQGTLRGSDVLDEGGVQQFTVYRINLHLFRFWEKQGFYYRLEAP